MGDVFVFAPLMFLYSIILGIILGIIFNIINGLAKFFKVSSKTLLILDVIFMVIATFLTFIFLLAGNFGMLRLYVILGEILGIWLFGFVFLRLAKFVLLKLHIIRWLVVFHILSYMSFEFLFVFSKKSVAFLNLYGIIITYFSERSFVFWVKRLNFLIVRPGIEVGT